MIQILIVIYFVISISNILLYQILSILLEQLFKEYDFYNQIVKDKNPFNSDLVVPLLHVFKFFLLVIAVITLIIAKFNMSLQNRFIIYFMHDFRKEENN